MHHLLTRRRLGLLSFAALASPALPHLAATMPDVRNRALGDLIGDRVTAQRLAHLHLSRDGAAAGRAARLGERLVALPGRAAVGRAVREQRATDFESGRAVTLDGWLLAESEADLIVFVTTS